MVERKIKNPFGIPVDPPLDMSEYMRARRSPDPVEFLKEMDRIDKEFLKFLLGE